MCQPYLYLGSSTRVIMYHVWCMYPKPIVSKLSEIWSGSWYFNHTGSRGQKGNVSRIRTATLPESAVFPRPGSNNKKEEGEKVCLTFLCSHEFHKIVYYLFYEPVGIARIWANWQRSKVFYNQKKLLRSSPKYELVIGDPGSKKY